MSANRREAIPFDGVDGRAATVVVWTHTTGTRPKMNALPANDVEDFSIGYVTDTLANGGAVLITTGPDGNITGINGVYGNNPTDRTWLNQIIEQRIR